MEYKQKDQLGQQSIAEPQPASRRPLKKYMFFGVVALLALVGAICIGWWLGQSNKKATQTPAQANSTSLPAQENIAPVPNGLALDPTKDYGNKYANGILPVGDNKYTTAGAEKGKVYVCNANFVSASQAGAQTRGPWFVGTTQWDVNKKAKVGGSVDWQERLSVAVKNGKRVLDTNNLPNHVTGVYPVRSSDSAYAYDRNPNVISGQSLVYTLEASPAYGAPNCMGGEVGVMLTGVALFNGFDAGGRDAGAWEVQDNCDGHPQGSGIYHYHTLSRCISEVSVSTVIGYALDGFPITGPRAPKGTLTTDDLDECHGIISSFTQDGKGVTGYHYVMTQDFPYSVSCFRAKPITSPGQHAGGQQSGQQLQQGAPAGSPMQGSGMPPKNAPPPPL
ncbi:MAG TPA: YHYH protein [Candidatus Saccharimonadales bacterium]|nr:YHYH protein [Candidatus Saccharimonadales bacterium]